jgi:trigger factor
VTVTREVERLEQSSLKLTLRIGKEELRSEYDEIVEKYGKTIQIAGFRKGKAPKDVLVRKFSAAFKAETLAHVIEHSLSDTLADESFPQEDRPLSYSTPRMENDPADMELDLEQDLSFSVIYDVMPRFTVGPWKGLEAEVKDAEVTDEDIDRELEAVRERNGIVLDRDDGAEAAEGNVVTVNYAELSESGEILEGTERQDFVFTLGTGYNLFHFDDDIKGMKKGETRDFDKDYPEDFSDKDLAGKHKRLRVTLTALKERRLPDLDDDLAQDVDEKYETLEDLKAHIRERLNKNLEARLRDLRISALLEKILAATPMEIPESMTRVELESRWRAMARQFNADPDQLAEMMDRSEQGREALYGEWRPQVNKALQSRLIVEALMEEQNIEVSEEETERRLEEIASEADRPLEEVREYYNQAGGKADLEADIRERKFFDVLLAENTVKAGERVKYLDLFANNG